MNQPVDYAAAAEQIRREAEEAAAGANTAANDYAAAAAALVEDPTLISPEPVPAQLRLTPRQALRNETILMRPGPTPERARANLLSEFGPGPTVERAAALDASREATRAFFVADELLSAGATPDTIARVRRISRDEGLPLPLAADTYAERVGRISRTERERLLEANPGLRSLVQRTGYADLLEDAESLAVVEQASSFLRQYVFPALPFGLDEVANLGMGAVERGAQIFPPTGDLTVAEGVVSGAARGAIQMFANIPYMRAMSDIDEIIDVGRTEEEILQRLAVDGYGFAYEELPEDVQGVLRNVARQQYERTSELTQADVDARLASAAERLLSSSDLLDIGERLGRSDLSRSFTEYLSEQENTVGATLGAFMERPVEGAAFLAETLSESGSAIILGAVIGRVTGSAGIAAAFSGLGSFSRENVNSAMDYLAEQGYQVRTIDDAIEVLGNAELIAEAERRGLTRGVIIGTLDAIAGAVAAVPLSQNPVLDFVLQSQVQAGLGAGGEVLGSLATTGEIDAQAATIEYLAELPGALLETPAVGMRAFGTRGRASEEILPPEVVQLLNPEGLQSAADQAASAQEALETARAAVEDSATFARDPDAVRELLEQAGDTQVSIPVEEIERLYQEGALTDEDLAYLQIEDELTQEGVLSGDVVTNASRVLTLQGDAFSNLSDHIRVQPGAPTPSEARAAIANREADIQRLEGVLRQAEQAVSEVEGLTQTITAQLDNIGVFNRGQRRAAARLLAERYAARAALFEDGVTAQSLYERDRVSFERAETEQTQTLEQAAAALQRTPEFESWFQGSRVVDQTGLPLKVFHGSRAAITEDFAFDPAMQGSASDAGYFGAGFYFSPFLEEALTYAGPQTTGPTLLEAYLALRNPFIWDRGVGIAQTQQQLDALFGVGVVDARSGFVGAIDPSEATAALEAAGYDGVAVFDEYAEDTADLAQAVELVAFRPEQIKDIRNEAPTSAPGIFEQAALSPELTNLDPETGDTPDRISTRQPWTQRSTEDPLAENLIIGLDAMRASPDAFAANMAILKGYPGFNTNKRNPDAIAEEFITFVMDNLRWLYNQVPPEIRDRSKQWYDGARAITERWAADYRVEDYKIAGVLAALSPQKDWYQNVSLAERVLDIHTQYSTGNLSGWLPEQPMADTAARIYAKDAYADDVAVVLSSSYGELTDPVHKAMWVRIYDEAYNPRGYRTVSSEGQFIGEPSGNVAWGSNVEIAKAIRSIEATSRDIVSNEMGTKHKVRNFFNNILAPNAPHGDVTIDTHAVAASLLRPLSGNSPEVHHNFGSSPAKAKQPKGWQAMKNVGDSGASGSYGIYAEAHRRLADELGILPRQLQSITWEAVRGLFTAKQKQNGAFVAAINDVWASTRAGDSLDAVRERVLELAGGINDPTWYDGPDSGTPAAEADASYAGELVDVRLRRRPAAQLAGGDGRAAGADGRAGGVSGEIFYQPDASSFTGPSGPAGADRGRYAGGGLAPLEGAPRVEGAAGPDPKLVAVAERYAAENGIDLRRQAEFVEVDPERAARIADAYEAMEHAPQDPAVQDAYQNLISQTIAQYQALVDAGYQFYFFDPNGADPYADMPGGFGNPWNAMRDLRANQRMAVFPTADGFGSGATELNVDDNPLLADTGIQWPVGGPDGPLAPVLANDLFRAVHDAFGHGIEGAGFRARGEENAWQAHVRLFTGSAVAAITSETRGQNSWLNYGPFGEQNRTAQVEDTVFADQKTGLMPEWTWTEGRAGDAPTQEQIDGTQEADAAGIRRTSGGRASFRGREAEVVAVHGEGTDRPVYEISDPALFRDLIGEAKAALGEVGAQVFVYDDYAGKRLFLFDDGASGFALSGDDIVSVFSTPGDAPRGAAARVLEVAVAEGGRRLDAFDTFLPGLYARAGFRAVAGVPFSREFAPEGWDYQFFAEQFPETAGEPGVVYMVYDPKNATASTDNMVSDPDAAVAAQDAALAEIESRSQAFDQPTQGPQTETKGAVGAPRGSYVLPTTEDGPNLIRLSEAADASTFVHEVGHMFMFQMLRDLSDSRLTAEGRQQLQSQIDATRAWFSQNAEQGFADLKKLAKDTRKRANRNKGDARLQLRASRLEAAVERAQAGGGSAYMQRVAETFMDRDATGNDEAAEVVFHELWARGFEQYLGSGSAPSEGLRRTFARFAKYITDVYKTLRNLNVTLSPEITDVFDRLLATEDAIRTERRGAVYQLSPGILDGATPAEARELRRLAAEAEDEARTQIARREQNALDRKARERRAARREQLTTELTDQVGAEPVYTAISIITTGSTPNGEVVLNTGKLDRAEVIAAAGEETANAIPKRLISGRTSPKNPTPLPELAMLSGFPDIDSMLIALMDPNLPSLEAEVRARVDAQMQAEFGAETDPTALSDEAVAAAQNDRFQELQRLQLRILRRLAAEPLAQVARRQAEQVGAPAAAADTEAGQAARAEQAAATTPRAGVQSALARIRADVQRQANAGQRRAQTAAQRQTAALQRNIDPAAVQAAAKRYVNSLPVQKATPARYRQAASRLTVRIERAIADRNYTEAASLMEQRALNLAVAQEAAEVQTKIDKQRRRWRDLTGRSDKRLAQRYDMNWINAIRVLLQPLGMGRSLKTNFSAEEALANLQQVEPALYADIVQQLGTAAVAAQQAAQADPKQPHRALEVGRLMEIFELADQLLANARNSHGLLVDGRRIEFGKIAAEVETYVDNRRDVARRERRQQRRGTERAEARADMISGFRAMLRRIEIWARDMDNGDPRGPMTRYLVRPVMQAVDTYTEARLDPLQRLATLLKDQKDLLRHRPIDAPELAPGWSFRNRGELLMAILNTGNESNLRKLLMGGGRVGNQWSAWTSTQSFSEELDTSRWDAFMQRMFAEGIITKADMDAVQGIWDIFADTKSGAQAAHQQMFGYRFTEIEDSPVETPFGTYRGGYVPAVMDRLMNPGADRFDAQEVMSQQDNASMFPGAEKGFTVARTGATYVLDLDIKNLPMHFDRVMKFTHIGPAVQQAARLVNTPEFAAQVARVNPNTTSAAIIPWLQRTVQQRVAAPVTNRRGLRMLERGAATLDRRVGMHIMAANIKNAVEQLTGFFPALARLPARHLIAAGTTWKYNGQSARRHIMEASPFMRRRVEIGANETLNLIDNIMREPGLLPKAQDAAIRYSYFAQQLVANAMEPTIWLAAERDGMERIYPAAYREALARTGDETAADAEARKEVYGYADEVVRTTQGSTRPSDVSGIEGTSAFMRIFLRFYSFFNAQGNSFIAERNIALNSEMGWAGRQGRAFYAYTMILAIPAILSTLLARGLGGDLDELEDEEVLPALADILLGSQVQMAAGTVPFLGQAVTIPYGRAFTDSPFDDGIRGSAGLSVASRAGTDVVDLLIDISDPETDVEVADGVTTVLNAMGLLLGLPTSWVDKPISYWGRVQEGKADPEGMADIVQGILTGRDGTED